MSADETIARMLSTAKIIKEELASEAGADITEKALKHAVGSAFVTGFAHGFVEGLKFADAFREEQCQRAE
jgi:hypothetical protein